ncbi:lysozyme inhibitor LprI family protein [Aeromonas bestiarum]|uniref:lysozyme inhibitor LprI family protein n=1 Tax=Aeromonas bestiarum TaxID=105751 RepID=UPI003D1A699A
MLNNIKIKTLFIATSFVISPYLSHAASFDCQKAKTSNEKLICLTPELSQLDEQLAKQYFLSIKKSEDDDVIKISQRAWLKQIKKECSTADCLIKNYSIRLDTLRNWEKTSQLIQACLVSIFSCTQSQSSAVRQRMGIIQSKQKIVYPLKKWIATPSFSLY